MPTNQPPTPLQRIHRCGVVAVIRAAEPDRLVEVAEALREGGVDVMEVTFTVPRALQVLQQVADVLGDRVLLGAGTVLDAETARAAMLAGAEFIVAPSLNLDVIRLCRRYDKLVMPGAATPTEVVTAWESGADLVKIFPADLLGGPAYLKALRGPLPQVRVMPTGGITLDNFAQHLQAGAFAVGVGSSLVPFAAVTRGDFDQIVELARRFVALARSEGRSGN